jgi:hypothetical protein
MLINLRIVFTFTRQRWSSTTFKASIHIKTGWCEDQIYAIHLIHLQLLSLITVLYKQKYYVSFLARDQQIKLVFFIFISLVNIS